MTAATRHPVDLEREYAPSSLVPSLADLLDDYARRSAAARAELPHREHAYGPADAERLDLFPAKGDRAAGERTPLVMFVHGGYWQELGKADSAFLAPPVVAAGAAFAAVGYGLAPRHRMGEIVAMVRRAVRWAWQHAAELGIDPDRIHLVGSSAGAHLVASCLLDGGDGPVPVRGAVLLSGVYDLEPIRRTSVNGPLRLDAAAARRHSPLHHLPASLPHLVVARGEIETTEFARQHDEFVAAARPRAASLVDVVVPGRNHFDVVHDVGDRGRELGRLVLGRLVSESLGGPR